MRSGSVRRTSSAMRSRILEGLTLALVLGLAGSAYAGDVLVGDVDPKGNVRVTGDSSNNDFTVTRDAKTGNVTVTPGKDTTVNGGTTPVTTKKPVTGKVKVDGKGGDDKITIDGVNGAGGIDVKDEIGKNEIKIKGSKTKGKLKVVNNDGKIEIEDSSWGKRDIRPGKGTVNPQNLNGKGGPGSVGTPPTSASDYQMNKQGPIDGVTRGLPTNNPGQRGIIDAPQMPQGPSRSYPKPKVRY